MSPFREGIFLKATLQLRSLTVKVPDQMSQAGKSPTRGCVEVFSSQVSEVFCWCSVGLL